MSHETQTPQLPTVPEQEAALRASVKEQTLAPIESARQAAENRAATNYMEGRLHMWELNGGPYATQEIATDAANYHGRNTADAIVDRKLLEARIKNIAKSVDETPVEMIEKSGIEHDPHKAEHMAYAMKPYMDKAVRAKLPGRARKHRAAAEAAGEEAAEEYNRNPLNPQKRAEGWHEKSKVEKLRFYMWDYWK